MRHGVCKGALALLARHTPRHTAPATETRFVGQTAGVLARTWRMGDNPMARLALLGLVLVLVAGCSAYTTRPPTPAQSGSYDADRGDPSFSAPADVVFVDDPDEVPLIMKKVPPRYTDGARLAEIEGVVMLMLGVDESGDVVEVRVVQSVPMLDASAVDAARQWKFRPATLNGQPVATRIPVPVRFTLTGN